MSSRRILIFSMLLATLLVPAFSHSDRGAPVGKKVYVSENGDYRLAVDPRSETLSEPTKPLLTLDHHSRGMIWVRQPSDFEDFRFPLHVCVSNDGLYLVFGGHSAHNMSFDTGYREGLRFYDADGVLVRFVTRRDLPRGYDGVSTSGWYDDSRSHITAHRFVFFTPGKDEPMEFDLESGELLTGELVPGQGDDSKSKLMERLRQRALEEDDDA